VAREAQDARQLAPEGLPSTAAGWKALFGMAVTASVQADSEQLLHESRAHPQLASYAPAGFVKQGTLELNKMLHDTSIPAEKALVVGRLLCGGQGLRVADPHIESEPKIRTACLACLTDGHRVKETLQHFLFKCPLTQTHRSSLSAHECWLHGDRIMLLHRDEWSFRQLRVIRDTIYDMWSARERFLRSHGIGSTKKQAIRAHELWGNAADDSDS
jgi:hypothetical protein